MEKRSLILALLVSVVGYNQLEARRWKIQSPLSYGYAYSHYPFLPPTEEYDDIERNWWFGLINPWMAAEYRHIGKAYVDGTTKESLSMIFFNQSTFTLADIVSPGSDTSAFPFANLIQITPNIDYKEHVAWFGLNLEKQFGCEGQWQVGARLRIPFRDIESRLDSCCTLESDPHAYFQAEAETVCSDDGSAGFVPSSFAYRLDFLTQLGLVNYQDDIRIASVDVTNAAGTPPVHVINVKPGAKPASPFALRQGNTLGDTPNCEIGSDNTTVAGAESTDAQQSLITGGFFLSGNGTQGFATDGRAIFQEGVNYQTEGLGTNAVTQSSLWVVPTVVGDGNAAALPAEAVEIQLNFNTLLAGTNLSVINYLQETADVTLQSQRVSGIGDFLAELYVHRNFCSCWGDWFAEGILGATFPTAKRDKQPNLALLQPLGLNNHYEIRVGGFVGWKPFAWIALKFDAFYGWALSNKEEVASSFVGARVKNVGRAVAADVSWQVFFADLDVTLRVPWVCPELGCNIGYQPYVKYKDHIKFNTVVASDLLGNLGTLDSTVLARNTNQVAHTLKGEIFYQACAWQLFGGFNHAVAGKNAPAQSSWYLGTHIYF